MVRFMRLSRCARVMSFVLLPFGVLASMYAVIILMFSLPALTAKSVPAIMVFVYILLLPIFQVILILRKKYVTSSLLTLPVILIAIFMILPV